ncbi:transcriptional regulator [Serratia sp. S1B]|nr:transcriptional regulator [Serratia sp. S1B]
MTKWQTIILQLRAKGMTQTQIASEIGCSQNYISNLENGLCGKRLSHDFGQKLEALQKKHSDPKVA